jgi:hypothetical protein
VAEVVAALDVDLAIFNEFVDGPTRGSFRGKLSSLGYPHQLVSRAPARNNRVFAACRRPLTLGGLAPPATDSSAIANWLHVRVEGVDLDVLGLRVPAYVKSAQRHAYRRALVEILQSTADRPIVVTGDLNEDPFRRDPEASLVPFAGAPTFSVVRPHGEWSYISNAGRSTSRIVHVMRTAAVRVTDVRYHCARGGVLIAGPAAERPVSDHAALTFTVEPGR